MATPLGPKPASSLVPGSPPDAPGQAAGKNAGPPPVPPHGEALPIKRRIRPWPTTETPYAPSPVAVPPGEDWEEPSLPPAFAWEQTGATPEPATARDAADPTPLFSARRPLYKRPETPPSAEEQLESVIDFLQKLQRNVRVATAEAETPSAATVGLTLLQLRRLSRTGVAPDHFEIGALPKPPRVEAAPPPAPEFEPESEPVAAPAPPPGEVPPPPPPGVVRLRRGHVAWLVLTGALCFATLGLVGYLWTRIGPLSRGSAAPPRGPVARGPSGPAPEAAASEEGLKFANLALEAIQRGDFQRASDVLGKARKQGVVLPGLYYQAALLAFNQGQGLDADGDLERSISAHEMVPECWYVRANAIFFTEGPAQAAEAFEQAVYAAPFDPRYYFFRAECLRRNGNAAAAVAQFQQALRCRPNSTDTELIVFKIGLTKIETNTDPAFETELRDRLAQEPVAGDTLLLAAADAIGRGEFSAAADFLGRAALVLPPRNLQSRLRDYVFQAQVNQPDIAAVLKPARPAAAPNRPAAPRPGPTLVDPATRSLAEADPAGW